MDLNSKKISELKEIAKTMGLTGISSLKKSELIDKIMSTNKKDEEKKSKEAIEKNEVKKTLKTEEKTARKKVEKKADNKADKKADNKTDKKTDKKVDKKTDNKVNKKDDKVKASPKANEIKKENKPAEKKGYKGQQGQQNNQNNQNNINHQNHHNQQKADKNGNIAERGVDKQAENNQKKNSRPKFERGKYMYHDGTDGIISVMKERQVEDIDIKELKELDSKITKKGILEVMAEGYGFIRCDNFLPGDNDVYVSPQFIRRFGLRTGDIIEGNLRIHSANEKFSALLYMKKVNGMSPSKLYHRKKFEDLTPVFPNYRLHLDGGNPSISMRIMDLVSPIGKGQRGMIVSQPKTGKTTLLKQVAKAITSKYSDMHLIVLLIDERPEEVTDIKESIEGEKVEVIYSTFDELPENHKRVSEMVIERAKRLVESGEDVIILLDSITRLARAYNLTVTPSGRTLSGGLDPAALHMPKRFFGAARNMREGGSLTILATALVDTGSRMDDVVFEEFKGTGNMELVLDRSLSEKRIFPAMDISKSSTRRDDLLLSPDEKEAVDKMRRALSGMKSDQALEQILNLFKRTKNNIEFVETVKKMHL